MSESRIDLVAGARPNFMKLAPVLNGLAGVSGLATRIVHTGQHYDPMLSDVFLEELGIPEPDFHLGVGSGTHGVQTARILERYEAHLLDDMPDAVVVFGDVNSTIACALAAVKVGIPVAHVEAGLRSFDRSMPEEINRILTDAISDLLFVTEPAGVENLRNEGVSGEKVVLVGNTMIDTLLEFLPRARLRRRAVELGIAEGPYGVVTMHRPSNVDDTETLVRMVRALAEISVRLPLLFPVHPRTAKAGGRAGLDLSEGSCHGALHCIGPQSYMDHLSLMADARVVLTDSGGMQEECAVLGVPCVTMRDTTERPVTLETGASRLVGSDATALREAALDAVEGRWPEPERVALWDGKAGERIASAIGAWLPS